jgi:hypothetical protein
MTRRGLICATLALVTVTIVALGVPSAQQPQLTPAEAASLEKKLNGILVRGEQTPARKAAAPVKVSVTEREINAFLKFTYREQLPKGVTSPELSLADNRKVSGHAVVDLDAVRTAKDRGWLDPAAYLTGKVEVRAAGLFHATAGKGTFQFESAHLGAVPIPKALFQELVTHYSRSPELPDGIDIDKPFDLPARIREVEIQRGAATITQ